MFRFLSFRSIILKQGRDDLLRLEADGDDLTDEPEDVTFVVDTVRIALDPAARSIETRYWSITQSSAERLPSL